ncbi:hypothetical protein B296_00058773 [Ensete ventricosum]|uniref:Uncharacterized protein n=1 Tax=Ensete ventricosum TaxID=4639 RepID=A0A426XKM6_ENSVE|nr:hypothetical protein B296_00058773 [Ensete ventricosum]
MLLDVRSATFPKANQTKRPSFSSVCAHSSKCHLSTIRTPISAPECRIPMRNGDRSHRFSSKFKTYRRNQTKRQGRLDTSNGAGDSQHESRSGRLAKVKAIPSTVGIGTTPRNRTQSRGTKIKEGIVRRQESPGTNSFVSASNDCFASKWIDRSKLHSK